MGYQFDLKNIAKIKHDNYLKELIYGFEKRGILVLRNSMVKNATKRALNIKEFRGFVIADKIAPAVFINSRDAKSAQLFTLLNEVAHLWIGASGVSGWKDNSKVEAICNKTAAEFLMPEKAFLTLWKDYKNRPLEQFIDTCCELFKVSKLSSLIRAMEFQLITENAFAEYQFMYKPSEKSIKSAGRVDFIKMMPIRNS